MGACKKCIATREELTEVEREMLAFLEQRRAREKPKGKEQK
jgi:hypothetical protein